MPLFSSKLDLTTAAKNAGTELADVTYIKGAFKIYADLDTALSESVSRISNDQIVFISDVQTLYQATIHEPDYISTFFPSASWAEFTAFAGDIKGVTAGDGLNGGGTEGTVTLSLDTGSAHFTEALQGITNAGIFKQTGSFWATTNNLQVTGSLTISNGVLKLTEAISTPTAEAGAIYYSASVFYFGIG